MWFNSQYYVSDNFLQLCLHYMAICSFIVFYDTTHYITVFESPQNKNEWWCHQSMTSSHKLKVILCSHWTKLYWLLVWVILYLICGLLICQVLGHDFYFFIFTGVPTLNHAKSETNYIFEDIIYFSPPCPIRPSHFFWEENYDPWDLNVQVK